MNKFSTFDSVKDDRAECDKDSRERTMGRLIHSIKCDDALKDLSIKYDPRRTRTRAAQLKSRQVASGHGVGAIFETGGRRHCLSIRAS